jgi:hypothetical protein
MTSQSFSTVDAGYIVAAMSLEETQVLGAGGHVHPRLLMPIRLDFHPVASAKKDYIFRELRCSLSPVADAGIVLQALPTSVQHVVRWHYPASHEMVTIEVALSERMLALLEKVRDGGDVSLRMQAELVGEEHGWTDPDEKAKRETRWGLRWFTRLALNTIVTVPRTVWIERVLPNVGHGVIHLIELPAVPLESCARLRDSFVALQQAQEMQKAGLYDDAVGKCRVALDKFFELVEETDGKGVTRRVPTLKRSWETDLGKSTYDWLNGALRAVKTAGNRPHHTANAHYDQFESQMVISITTALIAYVARTDAVKT